MVLIAVVVYLLRYVWRVLLFGASYQLAVELREEYYRQLSRQHPEFYLRHRTGDLMARATNDVDRVVFAAGEGVLTLVDSLVVVYLLRYVWRVLLFGASYQLAVELREDYYRQLSRQHPEFYLRHRTGDLMARATNDVDRVVFAAGEGVLTLVDSLVMGCAVLIMMSTQISWQLTLFALLC